MNDQPVAWGMPQPDGTIIDCITPEEHARMPGQYTVPLYAAPQPKAEPVATIGMIDEEHFTEVCRKAGGNSNTLLYAAPSAPEVHKPRRRLTDEEKREMWTNATVNPCTHMHCYLRGIEDAEDAIWSKT